MNQAFQRLDRGISVIDTGFVRARFDASYLLIENGRAAFIETGPNSAVPRLLGALSAHGLTPDAVDYIIPTHVHLDHAGGVGLLLQQLPRAQVLIHPRGARHMADPTMLMEGVRAVYGAEVAARDYGELVPVPADRLVSTHDGMVIELGGRALRFIDTPGHARHHHCVWDERSRGWFTGDTLGVGYPDVATPNGAYVAPSTTPVQFDPEALQRSIDRLLEAQPDCVYLTHFGLVRQPQTLARQLLSQVEAMVKVARQVPAGADRHERLKHACREIYLDALRSLGSAHDEEWLTEMLATDIELNAQGMGVWLDRK